MPEKFNELLLKQDIIELYNAGITPDYGYLMNGRFEKDMIKTLYSLKTLSGNPISWEASDTEYLFPIVSLEPKQAGSGDPSPENVRPITGRDEVTVNLRGNNLLDPASFTAGILNSSGEITYSPSYKTTGFISVIAGAKISHTYTGANENYFYNAEKQFISNISSSTGVDITVPDNAVYLRFSATNDTAEVMVNFGKSLLPYEPYQPGTTAALTLPEIIYGGTVDAVTGVGSKTWELVEFDGTENWGLYPNPNDTVKTFYNNVGIESYTNYISVLCDRARFQRNGWGSKETWTISSSPVTDTLYITIPSDVASTVEGWKSYLSAQASAGTPVQVAYKLTAPEPFQATGNQALTFQPGNHTMYTDGNNISLSRKARRLEV